MLTHLVTTWHTMPMTQTANTTKTIARTATKRIAAIKAEPPRVMCYDLDHGFVAYETDGVYAWKAVAEGRGKLMENATGGYTIRIHSNCWFRLVP